MQATYSTLVIALIHVSWKCLLLLGQPISESVLPSPFSTGVWGVLVLYYSVPCIPELSDIPQQVSVAAKTSFLFHINKNNFLLQARVPSIRPALKAKSLSSSLASPLMLESVIIRIQQGTGILLFVINY